jgi:hypothetical protein
MEDSFYLDKYLKYKNKYLNLKGAGGKCKYTDKTVPCYETDFGTISVTDYKKVVTRCKIKGKDFKNKDEIILEFENMIMEMYKEKCENYKRLYPIIVKKLVEASRQWIAFIANEINNEVAECKKANWVSGALTCKKTIESLIESNYGLDPNKFDLDKAYNQLKKKYNIEQGLFFVGLDKTLDKELRLEPNNVRFDSSFFHPFEFMVNEMNQGNDKIPPAIKKIPIVPTGKTDREIIIKLHTESDYYNYFF